MKDPLGGQVGFHVADQLQKTVDLSVFGLLFVVNAAALIADPQFNEEGLGPRQNAPLDLVVTPNGDLLGGFISADGRAVQCPADIGGPDEGLLASLGAAKLAGTDGGHEVDLVKLGYQRSQPSRRLGGGQILVGSLDGLLFVDLGIRRVGGAEGLQLKDHLPLDPLEGQVLSSASEPTT